MRSHSGVRERAGVVLGVEMRRGVRDGRWGASEVKDLLY